MVLDWVRNNSVRHYEMLKNEPGFPGECAFSSLVLGSYLKCMFPKDTIRIVYGTYGDHGLFHAWLEVGNSIVDFTLFQFLTYKEKPSFYKKATGQEILNYAMELQGDVVISPAHERRRNYNAIADVEPVFSSFVKNQSYEAYLDDVVKADIAQKMSWSHSDLENVSGNFVGKLNEMNLRITRRFFSKWAIVPT